MPQRGLLAFGQEPKGGCKAQGSIWDPRGEGGRTAMGGGGKLNVARILAK